MHWILDTKYHHGSRTKGMQTIFKTRNHTTTIVHYMEEEIEADEEEGEQMLHASIVTNQDTLQLNVGMKEKNIDSMENKIIMPSVVIKHINI